MHRARTDAADNLVLERGVHAQAVDFGNEEERVVLVVCVFQPVCEGVYHQQAHHAPVQHHAVVAAPAEPARRHAAVRVLPHDVVFEVPVEYVQPALIGEARDIRIGWTWSEGGDLTLNAALRFSTGRASTAMLISEMESSAMKYML